MHVTTIAAGARVVGGHFLFDRAARVSHPVRERPADVAARRSADLRRRPTVFRARVHHRDVGTHMASGSTAWRARDVGARRTAADGIFGARPSRRAASGRAGFVGATQDLPSYTQGGGELVVFSIPKQEAAGPTTPQHNP